MTSINLLTSYSRQHANLSGKRYTRAGSENDGLKKEFSCQAILVAIIDYFNINKDSKIKKIYFVSIDPNILNIFKNAWHAIKDFNFSIDFRFLDLKTNILLIPEF